MQAPSTLALVLALPWLATVGVLLAGSRPNLREAVSVLAGLGLLGATLRLAAPALAGDPATVSLGGFVPGVPFAFTADAAGVLFGLLVGVLWPLAVVYAAGYLRALDEHAQTRFFAAFAASIGATVGVAFASNLLTLFVCYEVLTVATYPLVVHKESEKARSAGKTYARYTLGGGVAVLAGTVLVYVAAGSVAFTPGGIAGIAGANPLVAQAAFGLLALGFGVKAALVPLHGWLPDAMVAPTPVSGLLHAVAVVKSGVFGLVRVVLYVFGPDGVTDLGVGTPLAVLAAVTMLYAGVLALRQDRLKRGLAYSTVSQLSYIVLGLAVATAGAVQGALLHIAAHGLMKFVLFYCAGIVYVETHVETVSDLRGIGRRLPGTMVLFAVAAAGLVGFPFVAGFVSKWYLLAGLVTAGELGFAAALLLAGLLKLLFFWPLLAAAFGAPAESDVGHDHHAVDGGHAFASRSIRTETSALLLAPVAVALLLAVVFGVLPTELPFFALAERVAEVTTS